MMNKEQLDEIKSRVSIIGKYKEFDKAVSAMILTKDVPATITEVERLQQFEQKAIYVIEENKRLREAMFEIYDMRYGHASDAKFKQIMNIAEKALGGEVDE